jgi:hypothetical protein
MTTRAALVAGSIVTLAVTACSAAPGPSPQPSPAAAALAYMTAHPVAPVAGMTAGIVLSSTDTGFFGAAESEAGCPATLTAFTGKAAGNQPACGAFTATAETPSGQVVTISCGSIPARRACPAMLTAPGVYIPLPGDYVRFASGGTIAAAADLRDIAMFAVDIPAPDTGGPVWVTTPATGSAR